MRVVVIGGSGHIGTYLTPRLAAAGHTVVSVSRSRRQPYVGNPAWADVERCTADRSCPEFLSRVLSLRPDVAIDLICYRLDEATSLVDALRGNVQLFLHCGTVWVHGPGVEVPVTEEQARRPIGDYGHRKAAIESYLLHEARQHGFPAAILHPGHLVGHGWAPLNPSANFNLQVFADIAAGKEIALPNIGRETLHHVHADDVAQAFVQAIANRANALGQSFHICSPRAVSMAGYAETVAGWYGKEPRIRFLPWEHWRASVSGKDGDVTWDHIARSPNYSIEKAGRLLGYRPRYRSLDAVRESLESLHLLAGRATT